jgi:predicted NAD/FAD-binding protein
MSNHHLLQIFNQPQWLTIKDGSKTYVDKILSKLAPERCFRSTGIEAISIDESSEKVWLKARGSERLHGPYDQVIFGSHADQTVQILRNSACAPILQAQIALLSRFSFNQNEAVLHTDVRLMPRNRDIWTAWNYLVTEPPTSSSQKSHPHDQQHLGKHDVSENTSIDGSAVEKTVCLYVTPPPLFFFFSRLFRPVGR